MIDHIFSVFKLRDLGLPTDKRREVLLVNQKVKNSLCLGQMDKLRYFRSEHRLEIRVMLPFDG